MKRIMMLVVMLVVSFQFNANALIPIPVELTNTGASDGRWYVGMENGYLGPANRGGWGQGFFISESYKVSSMRGFIKGTGDIDYQGNFSSAFYSFELYKGVHIDEYGFVPTGQKLAEIGPYEVILDGETKGLGERQLDFDLELESGNYFFVYQGGNPMGATVYAKGFALEGEKMANVHTPEPGTMFLLGGGLLSALRLRKKRKV